MEKDDQIIRNLAIDLCENETDIAYRELDEVTDEFTDLVMADEEFENSGYTDEDYDEVREIVEEEVNTYMIENRDIFALAEEYDGNMANDPLEDSEWEEIYEYAPETYKEALRKRDSYQSDSFPTIPDLVWRVIDESIDEKIGFTGYDPAIVVDNIAINGDYGDFDDYKNDDETDEEFIERVEDSCYQIFPEERFVIFSL